MSIFKFDTYDEVIKRANDSTYGLAAGVITKDCKKNVNHPRNEIFVF